MSSFLPWLASVAMGVALGGCGGSTYSLGDLRGDGGREGGASQNVFCVGDADCCPEGGACGGFGPSGNGSSGSGSTGSNGSSGSNSSGFGTIDAGPGCAVSSSVACSGGATGYACSSGDPTMVQSSLACANGTDKGGETDYCCIPWPTASACTPDQSFPCGGIGSYAFQCNPGAKPADTDATLSCGDSFPLANGDDEYCCTNP